MGAGIPFLFPGGKSSRHCSGRMKQKDQKESILWSSKGFQRVAMTFLERHTSVWLFCDHVAARYPDVKTQHIHDRDKIILASTGALGL
jgi:hypothetical protein